MIVRSAAMVARSKRICSRLKMPMVRITSCTSAATAPIENCHSKRSQM
jgi:hypothetical protein